MKRSRERRRRVVTIACDQRGFGVLRVLLILVLLVALGAGYFWAMLRWSYSTGERAAWVQKFSRKGWICKTWEGEMAMVSMPGSTSEKFAFTVRDDAVTDEINKVMGRRVTLHHEEKGGVRTSGFSGEV